MLVDSGHVGLTFICTHNSRRSHLAQVWAQVGPKSSGCKACTHSAEAQKPLRATHARLRPCVAQFQVAVQDTVHGATNPTYDVSMGKNVPGMACSQDVHRQGQPAAGIWGGHDVQQRRPGMSTGYGAAARFATPYVDPKVSDGTDEEAATYDARCRQINEMLHLMGAVKRRIDQRNQRVNAVKKAKPAQAHA